MKPDITYDDIQAARKLLDALEGILCSSQEGALQRREARMKEAERRDAERMADFRWCDVHRCHHRRCDACGGLPYCHVGPLCKCEAGMDVERVTGDPDVQRETIVKHYLWCHSHKAHHERCEDCGGASDCVYGLACRCCGEHRARTWDREGKWRSLNKVAGPDWWLDLDGGLTFDTKRWNGIHPGYRR